MLSAVFGIEEIFKMLNQFSNRKYFEVKILEEMTKKISSHYDYLIVPPIINDPFSPNINLIRILKKIELKETVICSVCSGSFQLAHAKIIEKRKVTTHWGYLNQFKELFPSIKIDINEMIIEDNSIITAAGVMAYIDLCLYIIKRSISLKTAQRCSKIILFNGQRTKQSPYADSALINKRNNQENELLEWIDRNLSQDFNVKVMAEFLGMHERTFLRWFKIHFKSTPLKFINYSRLEKAKSLLMSTKLTVSEICYEVGYLDTSSFRRNFKNNSGLTPSEFRNSF